jgi:hypothetical protein
MRRLIGRENEGGLLTFGDNLLQRSDASSLAIGCGELAGGEPVGIAQT